MNLVFLYDSRLVQAALLEAFRDSTLTPQPVTEGNILLRWGNLNGADEDAGIVLNRKQPLKNCLDKEKIFEILKLNKVRRPRLINPLPESLYPLIGKHYDPVTGLQEVELVTDFAEATKSKSDFFVECVNTVKKYNVYLFDLNIFFMTKKVAVKTSSGPAPIKPAWNYAEIPRDLDHDAQKVGLLAMRAAYVLGLDFCVVHAGIDVHDHSFILDVSPVPDMPRQAINLFREQVAEFQNRWALSNGPIGPDRAPSGLTQITLFKDNDKTSEAVPVPRESIILLGADPEFMLRDSVTGQITYPSDFLNKEGSLGYDERSEHREGMFFPLAEIRPAPDYCPLRLTEKIRDILKRAVALFPPQVEWLAGSLHFEQYQIGGHIHFSNLTINCRLLRALDNYLAIPIMLIEDPATAARRRKQYGWLGSVRCKPHGGFEYRTPGSWLVSPELTRSCLCLAKIVATEYPDLSRDYFIDPGLQKAFYQSKKYYFYDIFGDLWQDITKTNLYGKYAHYLVPMTKLINSHLHWDEAVDLRKSWGLLGSH